MHLFKKKNQNIINSYTTVGLLCMLINILFGGKSKMKLLGHNQREASLNFTERQLNLSLAAASLCGLQSTVTTASLYSCTSACFFKLSWIKYNPSATKGILSALFGCCVQVYQMSPAARINEILVLA